MPDKNNIDNESISLVKELRENVRQKIDTLEELPTLPDVAMRVMELARDEKADVKKLKQVIITDPPLSAKLLKVANSAYYGRRIKASTIDDAIFTIGFEALISICSSMGVISSLDSWEDKKLNKHDIWRHSLSTAFLAKSFEMRKAIFNPKEPDIFLSALLHHIGWIVIDQYFEEELTAILNSAEEIDDWQLEYEEEILGMNHAELGALFLDKWGIPDEVSRVVANHHTPEKADNYELKSAVIQQCAWIAPYPFALEIKMERVNDKIPNMLEIKEGERLYNEMQLRYKSHIDQAKAMTDHLMSWAK